MSLMYSLAHYWLQFVTRSIKTEKDAIESFILGNATDNNISILDFGCGEGTCVKLLRGNKMAVKYVGVDKQLGSLLFAKRIRKLDRCVASNEVICFKNKSFNFVILNNMLHHISDSIQKKLLLEIKRVTADKSYLIIIEILPRYLQQGFFFRSVTFLEEKIKKIRYWEKNEFVLSLKGIFNECYFKQIGMNFVMAVFVKQE